MVRERKSSHANAAERPGPLFLSAVFCVRYGRLAPEGTRRVALALTGYALLAWVLTGLIAGAQSPATTPVPPATPLDSVPAKNSELEETNSPVPKNDVFALVVANQKRTEAALDAYERIQRVEIRKTGSDVKPSEVKVWRVFPAGTGIDKIPLTPDAKPISAESYRADLEKLEKMLVWAAQSGFAQQEAYAKLERKRKERTDLIEATHTAFIFTKVGEEMRGDRKLMKYTMKPNPQYRPTSRNAMLFTRVEGTVWVDAPTSELARIEGHVTEDISLALFLAKVYKGSYFMQERYEIFPGAWLPTYEQYDFDGRRFLMQFSIHERTTYTNYRRVGPPKEAVEVVRGELSKLGGGKSEP